MKKLLLVMVGLLFLLDGFSQKSNYSDTLELTKYYSFHNNMLMNLHHFFYELASNRQKNKLKEDGQVFNEIGDSNRIKNLSQEDRKLFNRGIEFYKENVIDKELLHSGKILKWLQCHNPNETIRDTTYSENFTEILNSLAPLYQTYFWESHKKENEALLNKYIELLRKTEDQVIEKMESLSGLIWQGKVRVDLTTYGNWASAYSPADDNIVISSIDPLMNSSLFMEFTFHESSHLLFTRASPFRKALFAKSKELGIKAPRQLWHAAMFYLSGLATKEALENQGLSHKLIMKEKSVFLNYFQNEDFKECLKKYFHSEIKMDEMANSLLNL